MQIRDSLLIISLLVHVFACGCMDNPPARRIKESLAPSVMVPKIQVSKRVSNNVCETVNVMVSSLPTGAMIFIDGKNTGSFTDGLLWNQTVGEHIFEFRLPDYEPGIVKIVLGGKGIQQIPTVNLMKITGSAVIMPSKTVLPLSSAPSLSPLLVQGHLSITAEPSFAKVYISGKKISKRPVSVELSPGVYEVSVTATGYASVLITALVRSGKAEHLDLKLQRKENALSLSRLAATYKNMGNLPQAISCIRKAINLKSKIVNLHIELINLYLQTKQPQEALKVAERANILFFDNGSVTYLYGLALFETSNVKDALPLLEKAVIAEPGNVTRLESLAVCYESLKLWKETLKVADRLIALGDSSGEFYNLRGFCLYNLGRHKEAVHTFDRAIALAPGKLPFKLNQVKANQALLDTQ